MAARKRRGPGGPAPAATPSPAEGSGPDGADAAPAAPPRPADPALAAFASFVRGEEAKEREAKRAAKRERAEAEAHDRLVAAKDAAAAEVKRLRDRNAPAEQRAAADAAYREALAAVVAAETGTAPAWAPPPSGAEDEGAVIEATEAAAHDAVDDGSETAEPDGETDAEAAGDGADGPAEEA